MQPDIWRSLAASILNLSSAAKRIFEAISKEREKTPHIRGNASAPPLAVRKVQPPLHASHPGPVEEIGFVTEHNLDFTRGAAHLCEHAAADSYSTREKMLKTVQPRVSQGINKRGEITQEETYLMFTRNTNVCFNALQTWGTTNAYLHKMGKLNAKLANERMCTFLFNMYHLEILTKFVTRDLTLHVDKVTISKKSKEKNPAVFWPLVPRQKLIWKIARSIQTNLKPCHRTSRL